MMKKPIALLLALTMLLALCACGKSETVSFTDVADGDWYASYVKTAAQKGYITGYDDGSFQPLKYITAGEFVKMLAAANGGDPEKFEGRHWSYVYWEYLDKLNVFAGSAVTGLRVCLDAAITRETACVPVYNLMANVMGEDAAPLNNPAANIPGYLSLEKQFLMPVAQLYAKGVLTGEENMSFAGAENMTRAEACAIVVRLFNTDTRTVAEPVKSDAYTSKGAFGSGTLFLGDSITYQFIENYLKPYEMLGQASYMAVPSTTVKYFLSRYWVLSPSEDNSYGVSCNSEFSGLCFSDALAKNPGKYSTVFFMLGSNSSQYVTATQYKRAMDMILEYNPDATIYMQTIPTCPDDTVDSQRVNALIKDVVAQLNADHVTNVKMLDTNSIWSGDAIAADGVHLTEKGLDLWYNYIMSTIKK